MPEKELRNYDIVTYPPADHHYLSAKPVHAATKFFKAIGKEWRILATSLPETILVRVYSTRLDLMRAAIVGAKGTPYSDGLFFFDIFFTGNYPASPPKVHFRSHGLHMNPNLYSDGRVCLSLLNTWSGRGEEKWTENKSTVLQLLVSLQGLVLNSEPYFNEPFRFGLFEKLLSSNYKDNIFELSCKLMIYTLGNPPMDFADFVEWHFQGRVHGIVMNFKDHNGGRRSRSRLLCQLVAAFEENGIRCPPVVDQVKGELKKFEEKWDTYRMIVKIEPFVVLLSVGVSVFLFIIYSFDLDDNGEGTLDEAKVRKCAVT
ncbi:hypothetical protein RJ639_045738 [Escallonia herrerae]|uniref:UBC core domain-containing protein n=1 Tax=Escallonia herrerae TaxID=1293975 RepID=A0AA89AZB9_9ASTE|nr:hypothetical protein RJ639_045738 [Escallonia herrerae]